MFLKNGTCAIYDPLRTTGNDGYTITKGWMAQIIILGENTVLTLLDYWWPKGFSSAVDGDSGNSTFGEIAEIEVEEDSVSNEFKQAREIVTAIIRGIMEERGIKLGSNE